MLKVSFIKRLLVYHPDGLKIELTIKSITDDKHIVIESTDELDVNCELFIFGQVVDNFHTIDKNYIFTIATAALQEVDRQLQAEKVKNVDMLARIEAIESKQNDTIISTYTRDNYLFKFIMPIGKIKIKKAIFEHSDITGAYKLKKIDGSLLGIYNGLNVIESHEFDSNGIVKFMLYDMNDNILACDNGVADTLVIV